MIVRCFAWDGREVGFIAYHVHLHYVYTMISGSLKFKLEIIIDMRRREGSYSYALKAEWLYSLEASFHMAVRS